MELWNSPLFLMNKFKNRKTKRAVENSPFLKKIATFQSVSQSVSEKAKLKRGDPPKIVFKKKGEPPKNWKNSYQLMNFRYLINYCY